MADIWIPLAVGLIGFVGAWLLHPWVTHRFSLVREYYAPFNMWCARAASTIDELLHWVHEKGEADDNQRRLVSYQIAVNFLETHDLLEEAFSHGWTSVLDEKGLLKTLFDANHAVETGYHLSEFQTEVIWSVLRPELRERHLHDEALAQSLWDAVPEKDKTQIALQDLSAGLKRNVPQEWPRWLTRLAARLGRSLRRR